MVSSISLIAITIAVKIFFWFNNIESNIDNIKMTTSMLFILENERIFKHHTCIFLIFQSYM